MNKDDYEKEGKTEGRERSPKTPEFITYEGSLDTWDCISVLIKLA